MSTILKNRGKTHTHSRIWAHESCITHTYVHTYIKYSPVEDDIHKFLAISLSFFCLFRRFYRNLCSSSSSSSSPPSRSFFCRCVIFGHYTQSTQHTSTYFDSFHLLDIAHLFRFSPSSTWVNSNKFKKKKKNVEDEDKNVGSR